MWMGQCQDDFDNSVAHSVRAQEVVEPVTCRLGVEDRWRTPVRCSLTSICLQIIDAFAVAGHPT